MMSGAVTTVTSASDVSLPGVGSVPVSASIATTFLTVPGFATRVAATVDAALEPAGSSMSDTSMSPVPDGVARQSAPVTEPQIQCAVAASTPAGNASTASTRLALLGPSFVTVMS